MPFFNADAAQAYKQCSDVGYELGFVSWNELMERYKALRRMCAPGTALSVNVDRFLKVEQEEDEDDWRDQEVELPPEYANSSEGTWHGLTERGDAEDDVLLHYIPGSRTGLTAWEFHPY